MSGSYDRPPPGARRPPPTAPSRSGRDAYGSDDEVTTGRPAGHPERMPPPPQVPSRTQQYPQPPRGAPQRGSENPYYAEAPRRGDTAQRDSVRGEAAQRDSLRGEAAQRDSLRGEAAQRDSLRGEAAQRDMPRGEAARNGEPAQHREPPRYDEHARETDPYRHADSRYGQAPPGDVADRPLAPEPAAPEAALEPEEEPTSVRQPTLSAPAREMYAPARTGRKPRERTTVPVVPAGSVTGRSLTLVIVIMCFLACLTAGAVYMMNQAANSWLSDISSEATVQVEPRDKVDMERLVAEVAAAVRRQPGIRGATVLSLEQSAGLLEPWLGQSDALKSLPVPRLIALDLDRAVQLDFEALRAALDKQFKGVIVDDHRHWQTQIRTVTRSFAIGGLAILLLVAAATIAIIVSATRSSMASNREIVEVLHFVGATDRYIAHEFEKHFLWLGIKAGLIGAVSAMAVFLLMPVLMETLGGGSVTMAEIKRLVGVGTLDPAGYVLLGLVVVVVAALCMLTSRLGVYRILNSRH